MITAILAALGALVGWLAIQSIRLHSAESKLVLTEEAKVDDDITQKIHALDDSDLDLKLAEDLKRGPFSK